LPRVLRFIGKFLIGVREIIAKAETEGKKKGEKNEGILAN